MIQYFSPKDPDETIIIGINFEGTPTNPLLVGGESIVSATWTILSESGVNTTGMAKIHGVDLQLAPIVRQQITGGIAGRTYLHKCTILTSAGRTLVGSGLQKCIIGSAG
jgi:hypothetical protein